MAKKYAAYVLRTSDAERRSHGGFQWPKRGAVVAPDWTPKKVCGGGLHGLLHGLGDASLLSWRYDATWQVIGLSDAQLAAALELGGKCKFPSGTVVFSGDRKSATEYLAAHDPLAVCIPGYFVTAGNSGTATAGDSGTATAGHYGTATAGYSGTATAGDSGTATAGDYGTATAGHYGTATAGDYGTATAGHYGTATAGYSGTATAGDYGTLQIRWWDGSRCRIVTGYPGEDGIEPNVAYRLDASRQLVEAVR